MPDPPEQLALGLGDERVPRPDQHVDRLEAVDQPERHRCQALNPAQAQNRVGAGGLHRVQHRRVDAPLALRWRAADDLFDAGDLRDEHRHEGGREHRIAPARHIRANRIDRNQLVAEQHAVAHLDLEFAHGPELRRGERADLVLGECDVLLDRVGDLGRGAPEFGVRDDEVLGDQSSNSWE